MFRGSATVENGAFEMEFITPLDVGYGGANARVVAYGVFGDADAAGLVDSIRVADVVAESTDSAGPAIEYTIVGRENFVSGDPVQIGDRLLLTLADSSGINLAGGLGHGITLEIDGRSEEATNLTDGFAYGADNHTVGQIEHVLVGLEPGERRFKIKAWDNANNSSALEFDAEVVASDGPLVRDLLNYPNPMADSTRFSFVAAQSLESFALDLFTLSGRKIKSFSLNFVNSGYNDDIIWRGEDFDGDRVATGVYVYRASASPRAGGAGFEEFGKIVVVNIR